MNPASLIDRAAIVTKSILDGTRRTIVDISANGSCDVGVLRKRAFRDFKMDSRNESAYMDMVFARDSSVSRREKVKALWKFLDARGDLQPHRGITR